MGFDPVTYMGNLGGATSQRQQSPALWAGDTMCPWNAIVDGSVPGMAWHDNFQDLPVPLGTAPTLTTEIALGSYKGFATSTGTIKRTNSINSVVIPGGAVQFLMDSTSAHTASLAFTLGQFPMTALTSTSGRLWFEACVAVSTIAATSIGTFVGLAETDLFTLATAVPFTSNTGAAFSTGGCLLGFNSLTTAASQFITGYNDRATTLTAVGATDCTALTAFTFTRLGISYDPTRTGTSATVPQTCAVQFFQDNVMLANGIPKATITGTTNLKVALMSPLMSVVVGSSVTTPSAYLKWWKIAAQFLN